MHIYLKKKFNMKNFKYIKHYLKEFDENVLYEHCNTCIYVYIHYLFLFN